MSDSEEKINAGQADEKQEYNSVENNQSTETLKNMIMRIAMDEDYKQLLIHNPDQAIAEYELTDMQKVLIRSLDEEDIEKLSPDNIDEYFSADSAVYTPEYQNEVIQEDAKEDDI